MVMHQQVYVIGRHNIVEYAQTISPPSLKQPIKPPPSIHLKFKQKLFLVTALRNVPYLTSNKVPIRSSHNVPSMELVFIDICIGSVFTPCESLSHQFTRNCLALANPMSPEV
jgi:hypothetical protein